MYLCHLMFVRGIEQTAGKFVSLLDVTLTQPMPARGGFKANVVTPPKPGVMLEDVSGLVECRCGFVRLTGYRMVDS